MVKLYPTCCKSDYVCCKTEEEIKNHNPDIVIECPKMDCDANIGFSKKILFLEYDIECRNGHMVRGFVKTAIRYEYEKRANKRRDCENESK